MAKLPDPREEKVVKLSCNYLKVESPKTKNHTKGKLVQAVRVEAREPLRKWRHLRVLCGNGDCTGTSS